MGYLKKGYYIKPCDDFENLYNDLLEDNFNKDFAESFLELDSKNLKIVKVSLKEEYKDVIKKDNDNTFYYLHTFEKQKSIEELDIVHYGFIEITSDFCNIEIKDYLIKFVEQLEL